jgi:hypothetical protein
MVKKDGGPPGWAALLKILFTAWSYVLRLWRRPATITVTAAPADVVADSSEEVCLMLQETKKYLQLEVGEVFTQGVVDVTHYAKREVRVAGVLKVVANRVGRRRNEFYWLEDQSNLPLFGPNAVCDVVGRIK